MKKKEEKNETPLLKLLFIIETENLLLLALLNHTQLLQLLIVVA